MVLRHSSQLHPHHLLAFAKFASDLRSRKQDENQSPRFPDRLELTKGKKEEDSFQKWPGFISACFQKHLFWSPYD